jgi:hypothetical protein
MWTVHEATEADHMDATGSHEFEAAAIGYVSLQAVSVNASSLSEGTLKAIQSSAGKDFHIKSCDGISIICHKERLACASIILRLFLSPIGLHLASRDYVQILRSLHIRACMCMCAPFLGPKLSTVRRDLLLSSKFDGM